MLHRPASEQQRLFVTQADHTAVSCTLLCMGAGRTLHRPFVLPTNGASLRFVEKLFISPLETRQPITEKKQKKTERCSCPAQHRDTSVSCILEPTILTPPEPGVASSTASHTTPSKLQSSARQSVASCSLAKPAKPHCVHSHVVWSVLR